MSSNYHQNRLAIYSGWTRVLKTETRRLHMKFFNQLIKDESGATAIEYGLIAALIAVAAITAMGTLGNELSDTFTTVSDEMAAA